MSLVCTHLLFPHQQIISVRHLSIRTKSDHFCLAWTTTSLSTPCPRIAEISITLSMSVRRRILRIWSNSAKQALRIGCTKREKGKGRYFNFPILKNNTNIWIQVHWRSPCQCLASSKNDYPYIFFIHQQKSFYPLKETNLIKIVLHSIH